MTEQTKLLKDRKARKSAPPWALMFGDLVAHFIAWGVTFHVIGPIFLPKRSSGTEVALTVGFATVGWLVGWYNDLYQSNVGRERTHTMLRTIRSLVTVTMLAALSGVAFNLSARELAVGIILLWVLTLFSHAVVSARVRVRRSFGHNRDRLLIVGANHDARQLVDLLKLNPELGLDPVAVVGNAAEASLIGLESLFMGPALRAKEHIEALDVKHAIVITSAIPTGDVQSTIAMLKETDAELMLAAELGVMQQRALQARPIAFAPMFRVDEGAPRARKLLLKRGVDLVIATIALVLTIPIQVLAVIAIKLNDGGKILYRQTRLGIDGQEFVIRRFRTMHLDAEGALPLDQIPEVWADERMTKVGRLLEVTGFNEIPQLWNILRGDMSIVGPRPGYPAIDSNTRPLAMRPGLTGIWRIEANLDPSSPLRHQVHDIYVENWSILLDTGILLSSIELIMVRFLRGASWRHAVREESTAAAAAAAARSGTAIGVSEPALS